MSSSTSRLRMGSDSDLLLESLMKWLHTFPVTAARDTIENVCDGVAMAQVLNLLAPDQFDTTWLSKVSDVGDNKRLKLNNLRKVLTGTLDYLKDVVGMQLSQFPLPDINKVVEYDNAHLGRLLQLILGVAINCSKQAEYIQAIMEMEEQVQRVVMMAIQEMHGMPTHSIQSLPILEDDMQVKKLMEEMESTRVEKESLAQKCHELEMRLNLMKEEKSNLSAEFEHLQAQLGSRGSGGPVDSGIRYKELKKENETLKQELESIEAQKDETQSKVEELEGRLEESEEKVTDLQKLADQARGLKDEVDILRETSEKVGKYEGIIETYKKKLDDMGDLKRQIKYLEDKNTEYMENNIVLEEELGKVSKKKPQADLFRKQVSELNIKLTSETERADKIAFENAKLMEKLEALSIEKDRISVEREQLKETLEELKCTQVGPSSPEFSQLSEEPDSGMLENIPPSVKARLLRLEKENKQLKKYKSASAGSTGSDTLVLQTMVDDMKEREEELGNKNRESNKKVMELEARLEEVTASANMAVPRVPGSREELELKVVEANKKIGHLKETLQKKEAEMAGMEERYKKYIEKAKSVIKTLDPKQNPNAAPEVSALKAQLNEKDKVIDELEKETEKAKAIREMEERLMASAFYDLSMKLHRGAVEDRLKNLSQGQSFLARQRQVNTRKGGYNGQEYYYD